MEPPVPIIFVMMLARDFARYIQIERVHEDAVMCYNMLYML